ncbi:MAG: type I secretion system permease/ATPase [Candidatus Parcubacteria bacterium]|nr:type I secretion system permease/ATPase [Burkholderiales bacterium]
MDSATPGTNPPTAAPRETAGGVREPGIRQFREDVIHHDPLLDCLVELTRIHGRPSTRASLSAGLPVPKSGLTPTLLSRAAARAGLSTKILRRPVDKIESALLPVILLLHDNQACLLLDWSAEEGKALLLFPESGQGTVALSREELLSRYTGIAIFCRPQFRFDARAPEVQKLAQRHWFWGAFFDQAGLYRDVLVAALLINVFALVMPLFSMTVYDRVLPNFAVETLWAMVIGIALILGFDYALRLMRGHFIDLASSRIDYDLSSLIMQRVLAMRMKDRPDSVGSFAATLRSFESLRDFLASATVSVLIDLPFTLIFLGLLTWICWPLVFPVIIGFAAMTIYGYIIQHKMQDLSQATYRAGALRNSTLIESLTALEAIKAHTAESVMQRKWESTTAYLAQVNRKLRFLSSSATNGALTIQMVITTSMVLIGVYMVHAGSTTMGGLIASTMLASRALSPLGQLVGLLLQYQGARMALTHLETTMTRETERSNESSFIHRPELRGDIEMRDVHFAYSEKMPEVIKGLSLKIKTGEHVVVLGRIGSGKTTLNKLVLGLYAPTAGAVFLDGVDMRQLDPADVRRSIGYVAQSCMLFYGTLRENIAIGAPYADDRAIVEAARIAGLSEFVDRHPLGFDMVIGERGDTLSGGQLQGVSIARAVLMNPPILLLDEPTSSMDYQSERELMNRLAQYAAGKTMIVVTHRSSLLELASRIIVMDDGRVMADGPREQVVEALRTGKVGRAS